MDVMFLNPFNLWTRRPMRPLSFEFALSIDGLFL
jgi:hypothetical protein